jgi:hypothetical protein
VSLTLAFLSGCQAYNMETGLLLPTPHYLRHPPQYFPPSPPFPLQREYDSLVEAEKLQEENVRPAVP